MEVRLSLSSPSYQDREINPRQPVGIPVIAAMIIADSHGRHQANTASPGTELSVLTEAGLIGLALISGLLTGLSPVRRRSTSYCPISKGSTSSGEEALYDPRTGEDSRRITAGLPPCVRLGGDETRARRDPELLRPDTTVPARFFCRKDGSLRDRLKGIPRRDAP